MPRVIEFGCSLVFMAGVAAAADQTGPPTAGQSGSLIIEGVRTEGGAPAPFSKIIDLRTGNSRMSQQTGATVILSGFDGLAWDLTNGIVSLVDVPAQVADGRARAFVDRAGWRRLGEVTGANIVRRTDGATPTVTYRAEDASDVEIVYDATSGLPKRVTVDTEYGPSETTYEDWRPVGAMLYPFRQVQVGATGMTIATEVRQIRSAGPVRPAEFVRPKAQSHGHLVNGEPARVEFQLTGARQSHILVPATISGEAATLIFDTGGSNYLTTESMQKFKLPVSGGVALVGVGTSNSDGGYATVDRLALGSAELRDQTVVVGPSPFPPGGTTDGLTGYEFMAEFRTTIDYAAKTLTFEPYDRPWTGRGMKLPYYSDQNLIYVEAKIGNAKGLFRLDTGDGGTLTIFPNFARANGLAASNTARASGGGFGGQVVASEGSLGSFSLAGLRFENLPVRFSENKAGGFATRTIAGNLGAGILQCYRMTFDYRRRFVAFEPKPETPNCGRGAKVSAL